MTAQNELARLEAGGLIQVAALQPDLEYLFRHALVQDAAYSTLLKQDRRTLHRLAAETLLSLYPERRRELAAIVALHYERAGDEAAAAEHLVVAGEHAAERFANREAIAAFEQALGFLGDDDPRGDLRLRAAVGATKAGMAFNGPGVGVARLERALALAGDQGDRAVLSDVYFWIAFLRRRHGETAESSPELKHALDQAVAFGEATGDPVARAVPRAFAALGLMFSGELRAGAQELELAIAAMEGRGDPLSVALLGDMLVMSYAWLGEWTAAERTLAKAERLAERGDEIARLDALIARSAIEVERGDLVPGTAHATECAAQAEALGAVACAVGANVILGAARFALEDASGAMAPLERGSELSIVANMPQLRTVAEGLLGSAKAELGDLPDGTADWNDALGRATEMGDRHGEAVVLAGRARASARQPVPDWTTVLHDLDASAALAEAMEARPLLARVQRERSAALGALGRTDDAAEADVRSRTLATELGLKDFAP